MSDVQGIRLVTGEEIIATVTAIGSVISIKNPLLVLLSQNKGGFGANFVPWSIIASGAIDINPSTIVARYEVAKEVEDNYIANTTGMQVVSAVPSRILKG